MYRDFTHLRCQSQRAYIFHNVAYIMLYWKIIVCKISPGGGRSLASSRFREFTLTLLCDMGYPVQHLITQKVYKIET